MVFEHGSEYGSQWEAIDGSQLQPPVGHPNLLRAGLQAGRPGGVPVPRPAAHRRQPDRHGRGSLLDAGQHLGHTTPTVTMRYAHPSADHRARVAELTRSDPVTFRSRGRAGDFQVEGARNFQTLNIGGSGTTSVSFVIGV